MHILKCTGIDVLVGQNNSFWFPGCASSVYHNHRVFALPLDINGFACTCSIERIPSQQTAFGFYRLGLCCNAVYCFGNEIHFILDTHNNNRIQIGVGQFIPDGIKNWLHNNKNMRICFCHGCLYGICICIGKDQIRHCANFAQGINGVNYLWDRKRLNCDNIASLYP